MNYPSLKVMRRKWACEDWAGIIENYGENNLVSWLFRVTFDSNKIKRITAIYLTAKVATKSICKQDLKLIKSVMDIAPDYLLLSDYIFEELKGYATKEIEASAALYKQIMIKKLVSPIPVDLLQDKKVFVVGNSPISPKYKNVNRSDDIDRADVVIRFNEYQLCCTKDIGLRTNIWVKTIKIRDDGRKVDAVILSENPLLTEIGEFFREDVTHRCYYYFDISLNKYCDACIGSMPSTGFKTMVWLLGNRASIAKIDVVGFSFLNNDGHENKFDHYFGTDKKNERIHNIMAEKDYLWKTWSNYNA